MSPTDTLRGTALDIILQAEMLEEELARQPDPMDLFMRCAALIRPRIEPLAAERLA